MIPRAAIFGLISALTSAMVSAEPIHLEGSLLVGGEGPRTIAEWHEEYEDDIPEDFSWFSDVAEMLTMEGVEPVGDMTLSLTGDVGNSFFTDSLEAPVAFTLSGGSYTVNSPLFSLGDGVSLTILSGTFSCAFEVETGSTLKIRGGTYAADPTAWIDTGYTYRKSGGMWIVEEGGGPTPASEPEAVISNRIDVLESARVVSEAFETGYRVVFAADDATLAEYGTREVDLAIAFTNEVLKGVAVFGVDVGAGWSVCTNSAVIGPKEEVHLLLPERTLNEVVTNGLLLALGRAKDSIRGNFAAITVTLKGESPILLASALRYFGDGYYGPSAVAGEALPVTGADVVGYFKFDDELALGSNASVTASALTNFSGAAFLSDSRRGGGLRLESVDSRITGTLVSGVPGRSLPELPIVLPRSTSNATRYAGDKAWTVAFWFRPDVSARPAIWDTALPYLSSDWMNFFDGGWHHVAVVFNVREWVESSNPVQVFCDGGHWEGIEWIEDNGRTYSWHGSPSQLSLPLTIDASTGEIVLGGTISIVADGGYTLEIPLVGAIDDLVVYNRWCGPDDIYSLYMTGDAYVTMSVPDLIGEDGRLNSYKTYRSAKAPSGGGQCWTNNFARGTFDSNYGWSTYCPEHAHWQTDASRAYDEKSNAGYNVSFCDYLVDLGNEGEFITTGSFGTNVFLGASLTLGRLGGAAGNIYMRRGAGEGAKVMINDLRLNNGYLKAWSGKEVALGGAMRLNGDFSIVPDSEATQSLAVEASVSGAVERTFFIGNATNGDFTVKMSGDLSGFSGTLAITNATLSLADDALNLAGGIEIANEATLELPVRVWTEGGTNAAMVADLTTSAGIETFGGTVSVVVNATNALEVGNCRLARLPYDPLKVKWNLEISGDIPKRYGQQINPFVVTNSGYVSVSLRIVRDLSPKPFKIRIR